MFEFSITSNVINRSSPGCGTSASVAIGPWDMKLSKTRPAPGHEIIGHQEGKAREESWKVVSNQSVRKISVYSKTVSKKTISEILGHKSLSTTEIYLHSIGDSQVTAMKGLEGRFSTEESKTATNTRHQK